MTNRSIRTLFAAALAVTTLGLATGANAASQTPGFDKASYETQAQPAFKVVARQAMAQVTTGPTEKITYAGHATPAFKTAASAGRTQLAAHPYLNRH